MDYNLRLQFVVGSFQCIEPRSLFSFPIYILHGYAFYNIGYLQKCMPNIAVMRGVVGKDPVPRHRVLPMTGPRTPLLRTYILNIQAYSYLPRTPLLRHTFHLVLYRDSSHFFHNLTLAARYEFRCFAEKCPKMLCCYCFMRDILTKKERR